MTETRRPWDYGDQRPEYFVRRVFGTPSYELVRTRDGAHVKATDTLLEHLLDEANGKRVIRNRAALLLGGHGGVLRFYSLERLLTLVKRAVTSDGAEHEDALRKLQLELEEAAALDDPASAVYRARDEDIPFPA